MENTSNHSEKKFFVVKNGVKLTDAIPESEARAVRERLVKLQESESPSDSAPIVIMEYLVG